MSLKEDKQLKYTEVCLIYMFYNLDFMKDVEVQIRFALSHLR